MSNANIATEKDAVAGAFGKGMDYFMANDEERKKIAANASTLEEDEWETISDAMINMYRANLVGIRDLRDAGGLTRSLSLATQIDKWQTKSGFTQAEVTMDGQTRSEEDRVTYGSHGVPVPIIHKDFRIAERELRTSRNMNNSLRTDSVRDATRQVTEMLEDILFSGWRPQVADAHGDRYEIYGYTTHPDRNTPTATGDWGTASNIRDDIVKLLNALDDDNRTGGGFWLYIAPPQWKQFRSAIDPDGDGNLTVRERVKNEFDREIGKIRRAERLADGQAVMVDPSADVIQLGLAESIQTVEWQSGSGMTNHYKVMSAMSPEIKSDAQNRSGVAHMTGI